MKEQIIQNLMKFDNPKIVLIWKKLDEGKYCPVLRKLGGCIIAIKYDEKGNMYGEETAYFDEFGSVELGLEDVEKEFIPGKKMRYPESFGDFDLRRILERIDEYNEGSDKSYELNDFCLDLKDFEVETEFSETLYNKNTILDLNLRIFKYSNKIVIKAFSDYELIGKFELRYNLYDIDEKIYKSNPDFIDTITEEVICEINRRKRQLGFQYSVMINNCRVTQIRRKNSDNEELGKMITELINKKLKEGN